MESHRSFRFLWHPHVGPCPALKPRGERHARRCGVSLAAFHFENSVGLRFIFGSRLNHTVWRLPVYASRPRSPLHDATLGSGWLPTFAGEVSPLPDSIRSFQSRSPSHDFQLLQAWPDMAWRTFNNLVQMQSFTFASPVPRSGRVGRGQSSYRALSLEIRLCVICR
jgi:hypothetical protein